MSSHLCLDFPSYLFPSSFPTNVLYEFLNPHMYATWPAYFTLLNLVTLILLCLVENETCKPNYYAVLSSFPLLFLS
jgi:hypothetical protein